MTQQRAYREFLKSDFWKEMSSMKRRMVGRCERCPSTKRLQCHHRVYRKDWYDTRMEDLEVVCRDCHMVEHGLKNPEMDEFSMRMHFSGEMTEMRDRWLYWGKLLCKRQRKRLRHIAEMYSDNAGMLLQFSRVIKFHHGLLEARASGLNRDDAVRFAAGLANN